MRFRRIGASGLVLAGLATLVATSQGSAANATRPIPRYQHIFEIVMENVGYTGIIKNPLAPRINALATKYRIALNFYGVTHPSEPNYIANIAGSYFGIQDDNPYFCTRALAKSISSCSGTTVDHTVSAPNLGQQLTEDGKSWRGYFQSLPPMPAANHLITSGRAANGPYYVEYPNQSNALYASKHNPFLNFTSTQGATKNMVPETQLAVDLRRSTVADFSLIVPDQCHDMHGTGSCTNSSSLISAGDRFVGATVKNIMSSRIWPVGNNAIVITWDEDDNANPTQLGTGCCTSNPGGGHVVTIVITNRGKTRVTDKTNYNQYALLSSFESVFGLPRLAHANDPAVPTMNKLFSLSSN